MIAFAECVLLCWASACILYKPPWVIHGLQQTGTICLGDLILCLCAWSGESMLQVSPKLILRQTQPDHFEAETLAGRPLKE